MPRFTTEINGRPVEVEVSLDELTALMGMGAPVSRPQPHAKPAFKSAKPSTLPRVLPVTPISSQDGFEAFLAGITDRGRDFIRLLREHPKGIAASDLAHLMGFENPVQIGGLIGGSGMSKVAAKHGISMAHIYRKKTVFPSGVRKVIYLPGDFLKQESPLFMRA